MNDVCLIVEGAYPFISGGVSSWLHALIRNLPDVTFALVHISDKPDPDRKPKYVLPPNVRTFHEIFIHDVAEQVHRRKQTMDAATWEQLNDFHLSLHAQAPKDAPEFTQWLGQTDHAGITDKEFLHSQKGWELITSLYNQSASDKSFVDYFWTYRFTHLPLFALLEAEIPEAKVYHAVSVGYGGFLGALAKLRTGRPLLLTEHGIYVREREIEIAQTEWIYTEKQHEFQLARRMDFFQQWWLDMFRYMTRIAYDQAEKIVTITTVNTRYQLRYGAAPEKLEVIPNGIDTSKLSQVQRLSHQQPEFNIALIGRVVPIKDIKTYIRAVSIASKVIPELQAYIIGPVDEDPDYYEECMQLIALLGVQEKIICTGQVQISEYLPKLDVNVLTSLSEGQPLVILEGSCAGIPVIATDVGACRELLMGVTAEDQALGVCGIITPAASPAETANAMIRLWQNPALRQEMSRIGRERVLRYYRQETLYAAYAAMYQYYCDQTQYLPSQL